MSIWTHERLEALRQAAADGKTMAEAGRRLGLTRGQVRAAAARYRVPFTATRTRPAPTPEAELRARWAKIIPELKAQLVRQLERAA